MNLAFKQTVAWLMVLVLFGCANQGEINQRAPTRTVAVLGVTVAPGVESGRSQSVMTREFEELIEAKGSYKILPATQVRHAVSAANPGAFDTLLSNYASSGRFKSNDVRALQAVQPSIRTALVARVEKNIVSTSEPRRIAIHSQLGDVLSDRQRVVLATVRETQIRASMINMASGQVIWSESYRATPASESSYVHYTGSSFSGSLAASFANTMTRGIKAPSGPVPPSNAMTVRSLLREIVRNLPG